MNALRAILRDDDLLNALEYDLLPHLNLRDLWRRDSGVTVRQVANLAWHLPRESQVHQIAGGDKAKFGYVEHMLLNAVNLLNQCAYLLGPCASYVMGDRSSDLKKNWPKPLPAPGYEEPEKKLSAVPSPKALAWLGVGKANAASANKTTVVEIPRG